MIAIRGRGAEMFVDAGSAPPNADELMENEIPGDNEIEYRRFGKVVTGQETEPL